LEDMSREEAEKQLLKDLKKGSLKFRIHGKKLKGEFALVKMRTGADNTWLLIKHKDEYAVKKDYSSEEDTPENSPINKWLKKNKPEKLLKKASAKKASTTKLSSEKKSTTKAKAPVKKKSTG